MATAWLCAQNILNDGMNLFSADTPEKMNIHGLKQSSFFMLSDV